MIQRRLRPIPKPHEGEFAPYAIMYIGLLPNDGQVLQHLREIVDSSRKLILSFPEEKLHYCYAEGKWTIKEILLRISDNERMYAYRALRFARGDRTELPDFEQDNYAAHSGANERGIHDILDELSSVRNATISLFSGPPEEAFTRTGTASGNPLSVRTAAHQIAGHELHHMNIIKERYLGG